MSYEPVSAHYIALAVQMLKANGAPSFATQREKRLAIVDLARKLQASDKLMSYEPVSAHYIALAVQMLKANGAPSFATQREKLLAIVDLARKLQASDKQ